MKIAYLFSYSLMCDGMPGVSTHARTHAYTPVHIHTHIHTHTHTHACTHARTHARKHARKHASTHARTHARTHAHTHTHTHTHTHRLFRLIGVKDSVASLKHLKKRNDDVSVLQRCCFKSSRWWPAS